MRARPARHPPPHPTPPHPPQYACFRSGFDRDVDDTRAVWFGVEHVVDEWVARRWTRDDVRAAAAFWSRHRAPGATPFPFPEALLRRVVDECGGWFPVTIRALPAGTVVHPHVPLFTVAAAGAFAPLATWIETVLTHAWYGSAVATLARRARDAVEAAFDRSVDGGARHPLLPSRLHDFGFRGATCVQQAVVGGAAHLLSWDGSDTAVAAAAAQALNASRPVASSIPATEHSVMMAWPDEAGALGALVAAHGGGIHACVLDTRDYGAALATLVPRFAPAQQAAGGHFVLRPDSGDPVEAVLAGLKAAERAFGVDLNSKGFKVIRGASVIQGDGVNLQTITVILDAIMDAGFAAQCVAFGMGGALLQRVHRDTLTFATKLCRVAHPPIGGGGEASVESWDCMKSPAGDASKASLPGALAVVRGPDGVLTAVRARDAGGRDELETVWACGPVKGRPPPPLFSDLKAALDAQWRATPRAADAVDPRLRAWAAEVRAAGGRKRSEGV